MPTTIDLQEMTTPDKLRLMEALWQNLSAAATEVASPEWHGEVLAERDRLIDTGEETFIDWEIAKKQLRDDLQ
ncbi:MAG: addiction module protein [Terrimicrobiaceae bacterium]